MNVRFVVANINSILPVYSTNSSAGIDLYYNGPVVSIPPKSTYTLPLGLAVIWDNPRMFFKIESRSGLASKFGIFVVGGIIDQDYQQEIAVILHNSSDQQYHVLTGEKICQGIFYEKPEIESFEAVVSQNGVSEVLDYYNPYTSQVRMGGFGSTS